MTLSASLSGPCRLVGFGTLSSRFLADYAAPEGLRDFLACLIAGRWPGFGGIRQSSAYILTEITLSGGNLQARLGAVWPFLMPFKLSQGHLGTRLGAVRSAYLSLGQTLAIFIGDVRGKFSPVFFTGTHPHVTNFIRTHVTEACHDIAPFTPAAIWPMSTFEPNALKFCKGKQESNPARLGMRLLCVIRCTHRVGSAPPPHFLPPIDASNLWVFMWHSLRSFLGGLWVRGGVGARTPIPSRLYHIGDVL